MVERTAVRRPPLGLPFVLMANDSEIMKFGSVVCLVWKVSCSIRMLTSGLSSPLMDLDLAENYNKIYED